MRKSAWNEKLAEELKIMARKYPLPSLGVAVFIGFLVGLIF